MSARSLAVFAAHAGNALPAAAIARRVSAAPMSGTVPSGSPVAGFITSQVAPLSAFTQAPPIWACVRSRSGFFNFMIELRPRCSLPVT